MKTLTLSEAEQLKRVLYPEETWSSWEKRAKWLHEARELYKHGFCVCLGENILWHTFREMCDDLVEEK